MVEYKAKYDRYLDKEVVMRLAEVALKDTAVILTFHTEDFGCDFVPHTWSVIDLLISPGLLVGREG